MSEGGFVFQRNCDDFCDGKEQEPHECPFKKEIYDAESYDRDELCNCCKKCTDRCCLDIYEKS